MGFFSRLFGTSQQPEAEQPGSFQISWCSEGRIGSHELKDPRILLSDIRGVTASNIATLRRLCKEAGHAMVLVAPEVDPSVVRLLPENDVLAIRAADLPGQAVRDLLEDVAIVTGGNFLCHELGLGLSLPDTLHSLAKGGLCIPDLTWENVGLSPLGSVERLAVTPEGVEFHWTTMGPGLRRTIIAYSELLLREEPTPGRDERLRRLWTAAGGVPDDAGKAAASSASQAASPLRLASRYFVTEPKTGECCLEDAYVAVASEPLEDLAMLVRLLGEVVLTGRPILIVAPSVSDEALAICVVNKLRGIAPCAVAVPKAPLQDTPRVLAETAGQAGTKVMQWPTSSSACAGGLLASLDTVQKVTIGIGHP